MLERGREPSRLLLRRLVRTVRARQEEAELVLRLALALIAPLPLAAAARRERGPQPTVVRARVEVDARTARAHAQRALRAELFAREREVRHVLGPNSNRETTSRDANREGDHDNRVFPAL